MSKAKLTQSQLQEASSLIKQSAAAREARRKASPLKRADLADDPHLRDNRRALEDLLASYAAKSGLDVERFEQLNAKNDGDLRRVAEARKAAAVEQSTSTMNALRQGVADRRKALQYLANKVTPATSSPNFIVLEEPFAIVPGGGIVLNSSNIEEWSSTAKLYIGQTQNGSLDEGNLNFAYVWVNPNDTYARIDVNTMLALNGFWGIGSVGGLFPGYRESDLHINVALEFGGEVTIPVGDQVTYQPVVNMSTNTGGWWDVSTYWAGNLTGNPYFFQVNNALVSPNEMVLIGLSMFITYGCDDGVVEVDFSSGDFNILSPFVAVSSHSVRPPPRP